jgi:hypothetical protein
MNVGQSGSRLIYVNVQRSKVIEVLPWLVAPRRSFREYDNVA